MSTARRRTTISSGALGLALTLLAFTSAEGATDAAGARASYAVEPLLAEIRTRQAVLDRREAALDAREQAYEELLGVVNSQLDEITALRDTLTRELEAWEGKGSERVRKLSKIYAAMPPSGAAQLLNELDPKLATQILSKMKPKQSAAVLARLKQELAVTVSVEVANPLGGTGDGAVSLGPR